MAEELGKIEKPSVDKFKECRKLYFIPLLYSGEGATDEYIEKYNKYWKQVREQLNELETKLGKVCRIYHELVSKEGNEGCDSVKEMCEESYSLIKDYMEKGAHIEAVEDDDILTEYTDWGRCLLVGLQNQKVANQVYESYIESGKKRNDFVTEKIDSTLDSDEIGILLMREHHQLQFASDIQVFYVAPPALDEIKRWLREREAGNAAGE
jgi:hypothetical protein